MRVWQKTYSLTVCYSCFRGGLGAFHPERALARAPCATGTLLRAYAPHPALRPVCENTAQLTDEDTGIMKDKWMAQGHTASSRWTGTQTKVQEGLQAPMTTMSPYAALAGTRPLSGLHLSTAQQAQHVTRDCVCQCSISGGR